MKRLLLAIALALAAPLGLVSHAHAASGPPYALECTWDTTYWTSFPPGFTYYYYQATPWTDAEIAFMASVHIDCEREG